MTADAMEMSRDLSKNEYEEFQSIKAERITKTIQEKYSINPKLPS
jgi:hypothetical protein